LNETYSKVLVSKYLSGEFPIYSCSEETVLSTLLCSFALSYAIMEAQQNQGEVQWMKSTNFLCEKISWRKTKFS